MATTTNAYRQVRASFTEDTITVYQAYSHEIADAALEARTFSSPSFKMGRMTWIKPSFLWMAYRCGYASKDKGQERVLAIELSREGFEWALRHSALNHWEKDVDETATIYKKRKASSPLRVQWDPERDLEHKALAAPLHPDRSFERGRRAVRTPMDRRHSRRYGTDQGNRRACSISRRGDCQRPSSGGTSV